VNNFKSDVPKTRYLLATISGVGRISKTLYPEGGYVTFGYDSVTGKRNTITDYHTHSSRFTYNSYGLVTSATDAKETNPTTYNYYSNNVDVDTVVNGLGTVKFTYNDDTHDIASITDRLNNVTSFTYNANGSLPRSPRHRAGQFNECQSYLRLCNYRLTELKMAGNTIASFTMTTSGGSK
jgi:YD repeat-containing protein